MKAQIKGYYYDPATNKYFKIDKEHAAAFRAASEATAVPSTKQTETVHTIGRKRQHQQRQAQQPLPVLSSPSLPPPQKRIHQATVNVFTRLNEATLSGGYPRHRWDLLADFPERHRQLTDTQVQSALPLLSAPFHHIAAHTSGEVLLLAGAPQSGLCFDVWKTRSLRDHGTDNKLVSTCYGLGETRQPTVFTSLKFLAWDKLCIGLSTLGTESTQGAVEVYEINTANTQIQKRVDYKMADKKLSLWACEWAQDGRHTAVGFSRGKSVLVDFETLKSELIFNDRKYLHKKAKAVPTSDVMSLAFDPDSGDRGVLLGRRNGSLHYVDTRESMKDYRPRANVCAGSVSCLKYCATGTSQFLASSTQGALQVFDARMWRPVLTVVQPLNTVLTPPQFALSSDGGYVLWSVKDKPKTSLSTFTSYRLGTAAQEDSCKFCCWKVSDGSTVFSHEVKRAELPAVGWTSQDGVPVALCTGSNSRTIECYTW